ncbi:hypothetical protein, partial [Zhongshania sp.]|uniref:hypothetical protein n=1 Tax=Zhongshania sp. TaxID=1971902 RepID=UPI0035665B83
MAETAALLVRQKSPSDLGKQREPLSVSLIDEARATARAVAPLRARGRLMVTQRRRGGQFESGQRASFLPLSFSIHQQCH